VNETIQAFQESLPGIPVNRCLQVAADEREGVCLGIDFGGTWLRVCLLKFQRGQAIPHILQFEKVAFSREHKNGKSNPFAITARFIKDHFHFDSGKEYLAGISFSQPVEEVGNDDIRITMSAKGWNLSDYVNRNLYTLFKDAFRDAGLCLNLKVIANDVACTHLFMPEADFAVVIGTGFAFSYVDAGKHICVVEGGEFTPLYIMTSTDISMWMNEEPKGRRAAEKMISGKYLCKNIWLHRHQATGEEPLTPYVDNPYAILSLQHDILTMAALKRSGALVGCMLKSMLPHDGDTPIRIIADGTAIQCLPEVRHWMKKALAPHPVLLTLQTDAALYGSAKAALSAHG
jgi:hexokinase